MLDLIDLLRHLSHELRPPMLRKMGLGRHVRIPLES